MESIKKKNQLWVALNFIFPKAQEKGEVYVNKSVKFKVFVDQELVGEVGKGDTQTFISNMKLGCKVDILKGDTEKGTISSSFSWIVGEEFGTLYLDQEASKSVKMIFNNQNRVEIYDERDWDFIDENGEVTNNQEDEETVSDNI